MLKQKRYRNLFVISLIGLMLISCTRGSPSDSEAEEIIHDFWERDYEYTVYSKHGEGSERFHEEVKGKLISDPYQQYEQAVDASETQGIVEQYWYMQGENVVYNMKMSVSNRPDYWTTFESGAKGSDMYIKEDLAFTFDREETVSGRKVCVPHAVRRGTCCGLFPTAGGGWKSSGKVYASLYDGHGILH